jgi:hypothetical protein
MSRFVFAGGTETKIFLPFRLTFCKIVFSAVFVKAL